MATDPHQPLPSETDASPTMAERLTTLERRLDDLERTLSALPLFQRQRQSSHTATPTPLPPARPTMATSGPALTPPPPITGTPVPAGSGWRATREIPTPPTSNPAPRVPAAALAQGPSFEKIIGVGFAVVGALMLVAGVAFALLWAYQQGLLRMPPLWRCVLAAAFGFSLVGVGEVLRRRLGPWPAAGSFAAGIGIVYASVFAAYRLFGLMGEAPAFILLALTAAFGIAISAHARLSVVAVVSLIAGFMTPPLLGGSAASPWVLPMYLLALLAVGLGLSGWLGGTFTIVRSVAWWGIVLLGGAWALAIRSGHEPAAAAFLLLVWCMVHLELWWSTSVRGLSNQSPPAWLGEFSYWRPIAASISTSAWSVGLGVLVLRQWGTVPDWIAPAAGLGAAAALGLILASHLRLLIDVPRTDRERLGAAMLVQAGALLIATIALATSGPAEVICWLALGVGAGTAARWLRAPILLAYAAIALAIVSVRLILWDSWQGGLHSRPVLFQGIAFTWWTGLMLAAALAWASLAWLSRQFSRPLSQADLEATEPDNETDPHVPSPPPRVPPRLPATIGTPIGLMGVILALASLIHPEAEHLSIAFVWALAGAGLSVGGRSLTGLGLRSGGMVTLSLAIIAWVAAVGLVDWNASPSPILLHPALWIALAIAGCIAVGAHQLRGSDLGSDGPLSGNTSSAIRPKSATIAGVVPVAIVAALLLTLLATSLEASRVALVLFERDNLQPVGVTLWWAAFAIGLLAAGFARRWLWVRRSGLLLLAVAGFKAIIIDMAGVPLIGRVASFVAIGLLMLAVAAVYARLERAIAPRPAPGPIPPEATASDDQTAASHPTP